MSDYYKGKRSRNLYNPASPIPFRLSRSKLDAFLKCPKCFYIDRKLGVAQPPGFPFTLNSAVDALLKKEFDLYRSMQMPHPLFATIGLNAVPFAHEKLEIWRDSLRQGIQYEVPETNIILTGGVDDIWISRDSQELIVVDYKATSKDTEISLDADWQIGYKRQIEIYQWLFSKNGFNVSDKAYFVYCNGLKSNEKFDARLNFDIHLLPYIGNSVWVETAVLEAYKCLQSPLLPEPSKNCEYCIYLSAISDVCEQLKNSSTANAELHEKLKDKSCV